MKARNVYLLVIVSFLFLLTGFQTGKADTVQAIAHVNSPADGQIFYFGGGTTLPLVSGYATCSANYHNGDLDGTAPKYVPIHLTFTFTHANPGGSISFVYIDMYETYAPGDTYAGEPTAMGSGSYLPKGNYMTDAHASIEADAPTVTYRAAEISDVNWSVDVGEPTGED